MKYTFRLNRKSRHQNTRKRIGGTRGTRGATNAYSTAYRGHRTITRPTVTRHVSSVHNPGICERDFQYLARRITTLLQNNDIDAAVIQLQDCYLERMRESRRHGGPDRAHARAIDAVKDLLGDVQNAVNNGSNLSNARVRYSNRYKDFEFIY